MLVVKLCYIIVELNVSKRNISIVMVEDQYREKELNKEYFYKSAWIDDERREQDRHISEEKENKIGNVRIT
jgi:hypothetical protein